MSCPGILKGEAITELLVQSEVMRDLMKTNTQLDPNS